MHHHALEERKALAGGGGADNEPERHDAGRHRKPEAQSAPEAGPTGFVGHCFE